MWIWISGRVGSIPNTGKKEGGEEEEEDEEKKMKKEKRQKMKELRRKKGGRGEQQKFKLVASALSNAVYKTSIKNLIDT